MAKEVQRNRARRGATCSAKTCRVKLQKVLMMVRVINAFRSITDRLSAISSIRSTSFRSDSPDLVKSLSVTKTSFSKSNNRIIKANSSFTLASVNAIGETASIAAVAGMAATTAGFGVGPTTIANYSTGPLSCTSYNILKNNVCIIIF